MILCVGEILCDMTGSIQNGKTVYEQNAGGAPFNVACAAAKFGAETAFLGCVGDDLVGTFLEWFARAQGLKELYLRRDPRRNTTLAFVSLDEHGDRSFCFYRKNTADYHLPAVPDDLLGQAHIVHVGSLMLSERTGRAQHARPRRHRPSSLARRDRPSAFLEPKRRQCRRAAGDLLRRTLFRRRPFERKLRLARGFSLFVR